MSATALSAPTTAHLAQPTITSKLREKAPTTTTSSSSTFTSSFTTTTDRIIGASIAGSLTLALASGFGFFANALNWSKRSTSFFALSIAGWASSAALTFALVRRLTNPRRVVSQLPEPAQKVLLEWTLLETASHVAQMMDNEPLIRLARELAPLALVKDDDELDRALSNMSAAWRARLTAKGAVRALMPPEVQASILPPGEVVLKVVDTDPKLDKQDEYVRDLAVRRAEEMRDRVADSKSLAAYLAKAARFVADSRRRVNESSNENLQVWLMVALIAILLAPARKETDIVADDFYR